MARRLKEKDAEGAARGGKAGDGKHGFLRGQVEVLPLAGVKPNPWNPNRMTPHMMKAMVTGLVNDGWLVSQALLVWGKDEQGNVRNVIIDGEHRYKSALETGMSDGPMVFLDGLTEAQAKALTIKMNQKRGDFVEGMLSELLRELQHDETLVSGDVDLATALGFEDEDLMKLLAEPAETLPIVPPIEGEPAPSAPSGASTGLPQSKIRMQQLFFDEASHAEFTQLVRDLATIYGTKNVTDTTLEAVRVAAKAAVKAASKKKGDGSAQRPAPVES